MKQSNLISIVFSAITMLGCSMQPTVTSSSEGTVVIKAAIPDMGVEQALPLAEAECKKYGLKARVQSLTGPTTDRYIFACVNR
ncbi:MAG: hypothetical protein Q8M20_06645 [Rhodocyclaceae bacterium]|nr:hypothetical protein [Rhodocyclaceae bacterium]MDZ4214422.1 hypothetical protein [Rhodocyclaceae bacterium]